MSPVTCCCQNPCGTSCDPVNFGQLICLWGRYLVTASGFTGLAAEPFDKTVPVLWCGFSGTLHSETIPNWRSCVLCPTRVEFFLGAKLKYEVDYYIANLAIAKYGASGNIDCDGTNTLHLLTSVGDYTPPATITVAPDTSVGNNWCECWSQRPLQATFFLNITNSDCPLIPNGVYAMSFGGNAYCIVPCWRVVIGNNELFFNLGGVAAFPPEGTDCSGRCFVTNCDQSPCFSFVDPDGALASCASGACTCPPMFFTAGHADLKVADGGICEGTPGATGFDWTVTS